MIEKLSKIDKRISKYNYKLRVEFNIKGKMVAMIVNLKSGIVKLIAICEDNKEFIRKIKDEIYNEIKIIL